MKQHDSETQAIHNVGSLLREIESLKRDNKVLLDLLSRLNEASLLITQSLDPAIALRSVIHGARQLTSARYGALLTFDGSGEIDTLLTSGITPNERKRMGDSPKGLGLLQYLNEIENPLRLADMASHPRSVGMPKGHPPMKTFLGTPIWYLGERVGNIYLTEKIGGLEFTPEDERVLVMFAAQSGAVLANIHRHSTERRIRSSLDALINISPVGVLVFDAKTRDLVSYNQEVLRICRGIEVPGYSLRELLSVMTMRRPDGREIPQEELPTERAIRTGETVRAEEIVIELQDGQKVSTIVNATPILSQNEVVSVVSTIQDMTPLAEIERSRSEFLGMVSHELRMPLTTIKGSAATALSPSSRLDSMEMRQLFHIIDMQADHMNSLIRDLLDVSRIEVGTFSVTLAPTDVAGLVKEARSEFVSGGGRNNVEVDLASDLPPVKADSQRIVQVLGNLLANASKFSTDWSPISVNASVEGVYVAFSVTDEGSGISPEHLPYLFMKHSQRDRWDSDRHGLEGTGLGLAICKGIVEAHGGRIWAESAGLGLGARFTFTLPAVEETVNGAGRFSNGSEGAATERKRVLAVDDDLQTLRLVRSTLSRAGYTTIGVDRPENLERLAEEEKPDLLLMDLALPGTTGVELMERIRHITDVPVIFLSAYQEEQDIAQVFNMGADDYIVKPFSPVELVARVEAALHRRVLVNSTGEREPFLLGDLAIDYAERSVTVAGHSVNLTATEYELLSAFSLSSGRVLTHNHLLSRVWGAEFTGNTGVLRAFVKKLRRKLGDDAGNPTYIFSVPGVGYRMAKSGGGLRGVGMG